MALSPLAPTLRPTLLVVPLLLALGGCAGPAAPAVVKRVQAPAAAPAPVPVAASTAGRYVPYDPSGRDPFASTLYVAAPALEADAPPLARYALGALKVIGVVSGTATPVAMIETPEGKGYRVRIGDRIGHHGGRVQGIGADRIVVRETFYDPLLGRRHVEQTLPLREGPVRSAAALLKEAQ